MYRKMKRMETDASVDTEQIKEQIKRELEVDMEMQNMQMQNCLLKRGVVTNVQLRKPFTRHTKE
jgi:uncharacterized protein YwbE